MMEYIDRELSEQVWAETLDMMTPEEIEEMELRQEFERSQDYFQQAFEAIWKAEEETK